MLDSRPLINRSHPHDHMDFGVSKQSHLKLYCIPEIEITVAWKPLPKWYCVLNMLTLNRLALDSLVSDPGR